MERFIVSAADVILATGGYGRIYFSCTSAHTFTATEAVCPARRPAVARYGVHAVSSERAFMGRAALSRKVRAERAATWWNSEGERFMGRCAPGAQDLASRDVVSRAMTVENA